MAARSFLTGFCFLALAAAVNAQWRPGVSAEAHLQQRNAFLRGKTSPLALVHREYLKSKPKWTIGSDPQVDVQITGPGIRPVHAILEIGEARARVVAQGSASLESANAPGQPVASQELNREPSFRLATFVLTYRPSGLAQGTALDVYDTKSVALALFRGLEFFPIDAVYRVQAQLTPLPTPQKIALIDSQGFPRPYWIYGHLSFRLHDTEVRIEVYTATLDGQEIARDGFMLIFADQTSGKETYSAGRYLDIEGKRSGTVEVDFNKARNPPCSFSPVFTCPFPRKENRLPVPIRAGEKKYTGPTAKPLVP